jgi:hypothetical protein
MKSNLGEYKGVIQKLLEKTREQKVEWEKAFSSSFRCTVASGSDFFEFTVSLDEDGQRFLRMSDQERNMIFIAQSNDLPTSPEEEEVSQMIEEIYDLARRQALKIEDKLEQVSAFLDQV